MIQISTPAGNLNHLYQQPHALLTFPCLDFVVKLQVRVVDWDGRAWVCSYVGEFVDVGGCGLWSVCGRVGCLGPIL